LETKESVVTARFVTVGMMLTAAMIVAIPASNPASAGEKAPACVCAKAPIQARPVKHRRAMRRDDGLAYAQSFYNYHAAAPVRMTGWHGEWRQAPNDWAAPGGYAEDGYVEGGYAEGYGPGPDAYGPPPPDAMAGLTIDKGGWSGGVGNFDGGDGGGGGGVGLAIIAQGGRGLNGPTYNDYGQSFQNNPSHAGPFQNRLMGGLAPPPSSSSGSK
jgi:hypothetical protein